MIVATLLVLFAAFTCAMHPPTVPEEPGIQDLPDDLVKMIFDMVGRPANNLTLNKRLWWIAIQILVDRNPYRCDNPALWKAAEEGHLFLVQALLRHPLVNPNSALNSHILGPEIKNLPVLMALLDHPRCNQEEGIHEALAMISQRGHTESVKALLARPGTLLARTLSRAFGLSMPEYPEIAHALLDHPNFDPTYNENEAIRVAANHGNVSIIKRLLENPQVDLTARRNAALEAAVFHQEAFEVLLADERVLNGGNLDKVLIKASESGKEHAVKLLLSLPDHLTKLKQKKGDFLTTFIFGLDSGRQALKKAAIRGHAEIVRLLLSDSGVGSDFELGPTVEHRNIPGTFRFEEVIRPPPQLSAEIQDTLKMVQAFDRNIDSIYSHATIPYEVLDVISARYYGRDAEIDGAIFDRQMAWIEIPEPIASSEACIMLIKHVRQNLPTTGDNVIAMIQALAKLSLLLQKVTPFDTEALVLLSYHMGN